MHIITKAGKKFTKNLDKFVREQKKEMKKSGLSDIGVKSIISRVFNILGENADEFEKDFHKEIKEEFEKNK